MAQSESRSMINACFAPVLSSVSTGSHYTTESSSPYKKAMIDQVAKEAKDDLPDRLSSATGLRNMESF